MKLIYGRAGSGKTTYCMNEMKKYIEENKGSTLILIVPEQYSLGAEFELTKILRKNGTINIQVLTFKRLAYRVFNELGFNKPSFSRASKSMLLYHILLTQEKNLTLLKGVSKNRGLVDTVADMISECKRYNITWEMLENLSVKNEYLAIKLKDLALVYRLYEERIVKDYLETDSRLTILSKLIKQSSFLKGAYVWIDGFDSFTPQELEIVSALEEMSHVTVTLTYDKEKNIELFTTTRKTYEKLSKIAPLEEILLDHSQRFVSQELNHLEKNLFTYPYQVMNQPTKNIHIMMEANPYTEIQTIAQTISQKVREEKLRYENIAILTKELDDRRFIFKKVFQEYHIPYFFDDKKELAMQPLFALLISLFDILMKNYRYEDMFHYLKTGLTNIEDVNDIDLMENYVLQYGIRGQKWLQPFEYPHEKLEKINLIREQIITPILQLKEKLSENKNAKNIITNLFMFLKEIHVYDTLMQQIETIKNQENVSSSELELANTSIQVWNCLMELMDEFVGCFDNESMSLETFKNVFLQGISQHQIGILPTSNDQVMIGDIARTRNSQVQVLFIIGMNDGIFPMPFSSEGFITDNERDSLLEQGIELAKNTKLQLLEENFNIYQSLTTPSHELYLSYPVANREGGALRPSTVIYQIKKIFPQIDEQSHVLSQIETLYTSEESFSPLLTHMREFYDGKNIDPTWKDAYLWYVKNEPDKLKKVQSGFDYQNTIEYLDQQHAQRLYGKDLYGSVSRLELFANCPFSFYLKYGLKIKDRKVFQLDTPDIGLFLHDILDAFSKYFLERNISLRDISKEEADRVASQLVDEALQDFKYHVFNSSNQMKVLSNQLKRVVKRMVWIITQHIQKGEFEVEGTEIPFGKDRQFSAVTIELSDGNQLTLSGVIDRVDIAKTEDGNYIRIIDYKSYNKELKLSDIYYGLQLQLLVYMDAACNGTQCAPYTTTENELLPGGMLYLKLDDPLLKTNKNISVEEIEEEIAKKLRMKGVILSDARLLKAMDSNMTTESSVLDLSIKKDGSYTAKVPAVNQKQWEELMKHMKKILKQMGDEILSGNIKNEPVKKRNQTACEYCDYKLICRFDKELGNQFRMIHELKNEEVLGRIST